MENELQDLEKRLYKHEDGTFQISIPRKYLNKEEAKKIWPDNYKDDYYFRGKYFDKFEDMLKYSTEWKNFNLNPETAEGILDRLKKDIVLNIFLRGSSFTNAEFSDYVEGLFIFAMLELNKRLWIDENSEKYIGNCENS
ncbi:MAG TPA: hypothetical protein VHZ50_16465 [Puia sp.]|jgi:hypothetical protein|nr:hypothetical protein [Puia sp.]